MEDSGSWIIRKKISPTVYQRSSSSESPFIRFNCQLDKSLDIKKESSNSESCMKLGTMTEVDSNFASPYFSCSKLPVHTDSTQQLKTLSLQESDLSSNADGGSFLMFMKKDSSLRQSSFSADHKQSSESPWPTLFLNEFFEENLPPQKALIRKSLSVISWEGYFYKGRGKVSAVETTEEWMVDLSELYFGARFSSGTYSKLYHGVYKDWSVAIKIIRILVDDDDDDGIMAVRLEKQFVRETTFLSHLSHRNVIKGVHGVAFGVRGVAFGSHESAVDC